METLDSRAPALSPLFHYHVTRFDNGGANADGFVYLDDALQTLAAQGISSEDLHHPAFMESGARARPSLAAYADALTRTIARRGVRSRVVQGGAGSRAVWVREQIDQERPVLVGFQLPSTYWRAFLNERHEWLDPDAHPRSAASHCVLVVGYDDARQAAHVQDSRGAADGFDRGRWWMGYRVLDSTVVQELYALIP